MRPVRLELHGFTAFRDEVVVDFAGADLFALAGPTGSGKSSIIDGMCFALYGSVPRLDRRAVAPVISTGKVEARIRFDFTVADRAYTAVRVVRRTATGATTKEARLEHDGNVLAGDADAMTAAVERVLGLGFDQFTKSVVLPQGDFARFLHDKPSARQELLVKLLELDVYERMRADANSRVKAAEASVEITERHLQSMADATPESVAAAAGRVELLVALRAEIDQAQPQLDDLVRRRADHDAAAAAADAAVSLLSQVRVPDGVDALAEAVAAAEAAVAQATEASQAARAGVGAAEKDREALGDAAQLQRLADAHELRTTLAARITKGEAAVAQKRAAEAEAAVALAAAEQALTAATDALDNARVEHAAHAVAATLTAGEPCPVCAQTVTTVPKRTAPRQLADAEKARTAATRAHTQAQAALAPRHEERVKFEQLLASLQEQAGEVAQRLVDAPPASEIARRLAAIQTADGALAEARRQDTQARAQLDDATTAATAARQRRDTAWAAFDAARDAVAALGPPAAKRDDAAAAWAALAAWASDEAQRQRALATVARQTAETAKADLKAVQAKIATRCEECAVVVLTGARARDAIADALAGAQAEEQRLRGALEEVQRGRLEVKAHQERAEVAKALGTHLSSRGFERWLLDEALGQLADGASLILRDLSAGQYSLALDEQNNFVVIDHRSADERRSARTLSGGETFLASLSLALTLAEHLTQLAVGAEPRLESIFLDEGFGTLDPETLDVVAAAIEELGARGRTIGIVTHVRDLAERMPVRFDLRKGPAGSTVERVDA
jgi:exonuclease SbcC